jgi:hypothetical protein
MKGAGNRVYYMPTPAFAAARAAGDPAGSDVSQAAADTHQPRPNSRQPEQDGRQLLVTIPAPLRVRLPLPGTKPRRDSLRALITDLCAWRPLSARELAGILGRQEHKPLMRDHLSPMVADGTLAYTIPEIRNSATRPRPLAAAALRYSRTTGQDATRGRAHGRSAPQTRAQVATIRNSVALATGCTRFFSRFRSTLP